MTGKHVICGREFEPHLLTNETDADLLARREAGWLPTILVEAMPNA